MSKKKKHKNRHTDAGQNQCAKCAIGECDECIFYTYDGKDCDCIHCGGAAQLKG